jgi:hypothetical protein
MVRSNELVKLISRDNIIGLEFSTNVDSIHQFTDESTVGTRLVPKHKNGTCDAMSSPYGFTIWHCHEYVGTKAMLTSSYDLPSASPITSDTLLRRSQSAVKKGIEEIIWRNC